MTPKGKFRAVATDYTFAESKQKGTPFVRVPFRVKDGPHEGEYVPWDGFFTEGTAERTIESLRHCGCTFPGDDLSNMEGLGSKDVEIVVEHEEWTNPETNETKTRARVAWVNSLGGGISEEQKMTGSKLTGFAAKMKGALIAQRKKAGVAASSPNAANGRRPAQSGGEEPYDDRPDWAR